MEEEEQAAELGGDIGRDGLGNAAVGSSCCVEGEITSVQMCLGIWFSLSIKQRHGFRGGMFSGFCRSSSYDRLSWQLQGLWGLRVHLQLAELQKREAEN